VLHVFFLWPDTQMNSGKVNKFNRKEDLMRGKLMMVAEAKDMPGSNA